jgi:hypothetical protein
MKKTRAAQGVSSADRLVQCFSTAGPWHQLIIPDPRLIDKRIYRAAVSQTLRTTGLVHLLHLCFQQQIITHLFN